MEIALSPKLLYAYAQTNPHDGHQFEAAQIHCRIVNAETDEGYTCHDTFVVQLYGAWEDRTHVFQELRLDVTPSTPDLIVLVRDALYQEVARRIEHAQSVYIHARNLADAYLGDWLLDKPYGK